MDHRCPLCKESLAKRRLSQTVIARMEIECSHCKNTIRVNVHRAEEVAVLLSFGTVIGLAVAAYVFHSQGLALAAFGAVMASSLLVPVLERTWLRTWPRYVQPGARGDAGGSVK